MTSPSLAYQDAMNGIAILYDAFSNAENELDKFKNPWIKYNECMPSKDDYFIVHCPEYEPSIAITRYDTDLGGCLIMLMMKSPTGCLFRDCQRSKREQMGRTKQTEL